MYIKIALEYKKRIFQMDQDTTDSVPTDVYDAFPPTWSEVPADEDPSFIGNQNNPPTDVVVTSGDPFPVLMVVDTLDDIIIPADELEGQQDIYDNPGAPSTTTISSVVPSTFAYEGATLVTVTGSNMSAVVTARISSALVDSFVVVNATTATFTAPLCPSINTAGGPIDLGLYDVFDVVLDSATVSYAPSATPFVLSTTTLNTCPVTGNIIGQLTGTGFFFITRMFICGVEVQQFRVLSDTLIEYTLAPYNIPVGTTAGDVILENGDGDLRTLTGAFSYTIPVPWVNGSDTRTLDVAGGTQVRINGNYFATLTGVTVNGIPVPFVVESDTSVVITGPAGLYTGVPVDVVLTNGTGAYTWTGGVSFGAPAGAPTISYVTPTKLVVGTGGTLRVVGTGLSGITNAWVDGVPAILTTVSATECVVIAPARPYTGAYVDLTISDGLLTVTQLQAVIYEYNAPVIVSTTVASGSKNGGTAGSAFGANFYLVSSFSVGSVPVTSFTVVSPTQIDFVTAPSPNFGIPSDIRVQCLFGEGIIAHAFTYLEDIRIDACSLSSDSVLGGSVGTLTGSGFSAATSVIVGGASAAFTVLTDTSVSFVVPANVFTDTLVDIVVTTATSSATFARAFLYVPVLTVGSLDVTTGDRTGGDVVNISGAGFYDVQSVLLGGVSASFDFISLTQLRFTTPGGVPAGTYDLVVQTRYSTVILPAAFVYTDWTPQVVSLSLALYTMSVQHFAAITNIQTSLSSFGATTVPLVSSVQDISNRVAALTSTVNYVSSVFGGLSLVSVVSSLSFRTDTLSSQVAAVSSTWSTVSTDHWTAISSLSNGVANFPTTPAATDVISAVSDVSYNFNAVSQLHFAAISSVSSLHAAASGQQWLAISSLSNRLTTMSIEHFSAIQTILPSISGQSGRFLEYTSVLAWTSVSVASVSGPTAPVLSSRVVSSNTYTTTSADTFVLVDDTALSTGFFGGNIAVSIGLKINGLSDGTLVVVKRITADVTKWTYVRVPISNGTGYYEYILSAPYAWVAARYTNVLSGYVVLDRVLGVSEPPGRGMLMSFTTPVSSVGLSGISNFVVSSPTTLSGVRAVYVGSTPVSFTFSGANNLIFPVPPQAYEAYTNITVEDYWGVSVTRTSAVRYLPLLTWTSLSVGVNGMNVTAVADKGTAFGYTSERIMYYTSTFFTAGFQTWYNNNGFSGSAWSSNVDVGDVCCDRGTGKTVLVPNNGGPYYYSTNGGVNYLSNTLSGLWTGFATSPRGSYVLGAALDTVYNGANVTSPPVTFTSATTPIVPPTYTYVSTNIVTSQETSTLGLVSGAVVSTWGSYTLSGPGTITYSAGGVGAFGTKSFVQTTGNACFIGPTTTLNLSSNGGVTIAAMLWIPLTFGVTDREYPVWIAGKSATNLFDTVLLAVGNFSSVPGIGIRFRITNGGAAGTDGTSVVNMTAAATVRPGFWNTVVVTCGGAVGSVAKMYVNGVENVVADVSTALTDRVATNVYMNFFNGNYNPNMRYNSVLVWNRVLTPLEVDDIRMYLETFRIADMAVADDGNALALVGSNVYRSTDGGLNWAAVSFNGFRVSGVAVANNGVSYACTRGGYIYKSTDGGATWTRVTGVYGGFRGIATDSVGRFVVATTSRGNVFVSSDSGSTFGGRITRYPTENVWKIRKTTSPGNPAWQKIAWSPKLEMLVACGWADALVSYDAVEFTPVALPATNNYTDVCWSDTLAQFVMVSGGAGVLTSTDGIAWTYTAATLNLTRIRWIDELNVYVAISPDGAIYTSTNGTTYVQQFADGARQWYGIAWSGNVLVATSLDGHVYSSTDAVTWTPRYNAAGQMFVAAAWSDVLQKFVVMSQTTGGSQVIATSTDGIAWTPTNAPATLNNYIKDVIWVTELNCFFAVGESVSGTQIVFYSYNGTTWVNNNGATAVPNTAWAGLCWCPKFGSVVAVSMTGTDNRVMSAQSANEGSVWSKVRMSPSGDLVVTSGSARVGQARM